MNSTAVQHGRQPAPQQAAPSPTGTDTSGICRDFIWGICTMGAQCIYRHDLEFDAMKEVLKFCHDHQNRTGCARPDCTYLHTSRDEENLFLTTGQIPRVLIERYNNMSYAPVATAPETVPPQQNAMYDYIVQPPPPPPPPPPPTTLAATGVQHSPRQTTQPPQQQQIQGSIMVGPMQAPGPMQGPMPGPVQQGPMQGPVQQGPMQGPVQQGPMQGPVQQGPMQGPVQQGPMQGPMQFPMQGPMPVPMQGPMQGPMQQGPMQGPMQQGPMQGPMQFPIQGPMQMSMQGSMQMPMPIQGPMPVPTPVPPMPAPMPPPPPPPPSTASASNMRVMTPSYLGVQAISANTQYCHTTSNSQQTLPPLFDPTKPPPPIFQGSSSLKRSSEESEAGPSKLRKTESCSSCENCMQRLIRYELYDAQIEKAKKTNELRRAAVASQREEYERKKIMLKTMLGEEVYRRAEDFIDNGSSTPTKTNWEDVFPRRPASPASRSSSSTSMIHSILELLIGSSDPMPTTMSSQEELLQQLTATKTRPRPSNNGAGDIISTFLEYMRTTGPVTNERSVPADSSRSGVPAIMSSPTRSFPEVTRPFPEGTRLFPEATRPFPEATRPFPEATRPFPEATRPFPEATRPFPEATRPFPEATRPFPEATRAFPEASRPFPEPSSVRTDYPPHPYAEMTTPSYGSVEGPPRYPIVPAPTYHPGVLETANMPPNASCSTAPPNYMPGAYVSPTQTPPARTFYGQMPQYNGSNSPYPGMMPQPAHPPMPPQNPNNYFMGGCYPNQQYYPPYQ